ncbi:MAG: CCA tRNA nucleotidyltransferase [Thermoguttaceae bacterium]
MPTKTPHNKLRRVERIIETLRDAGARECIFVGGYVRDKLLGATFDSDADPDFDVEVYGLSYDEIVAALRAAKFGVDIVGKSFGTVKVGNGIDLSVPRRESKLGVGHTGFDVKFDPTMTFEEAASRRDFTINAIGMRQDGTIIDPFGGEDDIRNHVLRATSPKFAEDPLRVLRGMQFAARFGFEMERRTVAMCQCLVSEFDTLSLERIWGEWNKWATRGKFPSHGLRVLRQTDWLAKFPELAAIVGVQQNPKWHPEGDVWEHTLLVCDAAAHIATDENLNDEDRIVLMFAALGHDFGKPQTTTLNEKGNWSSPNHASHSAILVDDFLTRIRAPNWVVERVVPLVREHMAHMAHTPEYEVPSERAVRRLAVRLSPSNVRMWCHLCHADAMGCLARGTKVASWGEVAAKLDVREERPVPLVYGRDLIELGLSPGPEMGQTLKRLYEAQLDGEFTSREDGIAWLRARE